MTPERREAIIRLLRTRDEGLPEPRHRTEASAGFVHQTLAPQVCEVCEGVDSDNCTGCGGRGWVERMRSRDPYATNEVKPFGLDGSRHDAAYERDRQIEALGRQIRPAASIDELADANAHPYAYERARRRMWKLYDYAALDAALDHLRVTDEAASRALHAVFIYQWQEDPTGPLQAACARGLAFLDERLPTPLRAPAEKKPVDNTVARGRHADKAAMAQRDAEIRRVYRNGATLADLETRFGLKKSALYEIVNGEAAA